MADKVLGVFTYNQGGKQIGTITLRDGKLKGSTPAIQSIADSRLKRNGNDPERAFESLSGWGNGYLWIKEPKTY